MLDLADPSGGGQAGPHPIYDSDLLSHLTSSSPVAVQGSADEGSSPEHSGRSRAATRSGRFIPVWNTERVSSDNQFFVHPEKSFRLGWDSTALLLIVVLAIVIPVEVCFYGDGEYPDALLVFDTLTDAFFVMDIILNFVTAYHEGHGVTGRLVTDFPSMGKYYLRGWFAVDAIAAFPWVTVIDAFGELGGRDGSGGLGIIRTLQFIKIIRMMKVLRVLKLGGMMQVVEEKLLSAQSMTIAFQLLKMSVVVIVFLHNIACFWYAAAIFQSEGMFTWLHPLGLEEEDRLRQYTAAFYFAVTTGTTVGFGDITPQNTSERIVTTLLLIFSVIFVGQFLARFTNMISSLRKMENEMQQVKQDAIIFMKKRSVPRELQFKILRYIENIYKEEAITALDQRVMSHLSESLQDQLAMAVTGAIIKQFPLFRDAEEAFLTALCQACRTQRACSGDVIVREDQPAGEMYWIVRGEAAVVRRNMHVGGLRAGDWFGELSLFIPGAIRTATIRCETHCEFVVLSQKDFQKRVDLFPQVKAEYERLSAAIREGSPDCMRPIVSGGTASVRSKWRPRSPMSTAPPVRMPSK